mmetsp:Transcript_20299/g.63779  ORF Transcript_20299/g.63779 Transcript_20299/m.63779 type:complete len:271 (+) Transcript_20299:1586-2398(+)
MVGGAAGSFLEAERRRGRGPGGARQRRLADDLGGGAADEHGGVVDGGLFLHDDFGVADGEEGAGGLGAGHGHGPAVGVGLGDGRDEVGLAGDLARGEGDEGLGDVGSDEGDDGVGEGLGAPAGGAGEGALLVSGDDEVGLEVDDVDDGDEEERDLELGADDADLRDELVDASEHGGGVGRLDDGEGDLLLGVAHLEALEVAGDEGVGRERGEVLGLGLELLGAELVDVVDGTVLDEEGDDFPVPGGRGRGAEVERVGEDRAEEEARDGLG